MTGVTDSHPTVLAQRLDHLFKTVHPKDRKPYSLREVAEAVNEVAGEQLVSKAYLGQLRTGKRDNPSARVLAAIAHWFGVDVRYFSDDDVARHTNEQVELLQALRDNDVRALALRAVGLSTRNLKAILDIVESARIAEGLPPTDEPDQAL